MLPGFVGGMALSESNLPSIEYIGNASIDASATSFTFSSFNLLKIVDGQQLIIACHSNVSSNTRPVTSITVGGVSASVLGHATDNNVRLAFGLIAYQAAQTPTIVVTYQGGGTQARCAITVWRARNLTSLTPTATATDNAVPLSQTISVQADGIIIGAVSTASTTSGVVYTWSNINKDVQFNPGGTHVASGASRVFGSSQNVTVSCSLSASQTNNVMSLIALR